MALETIDLNIERLNDNTEGDIMLSNDMLTNEINNLEGLELLTNKSQIKETGVGYDSVKDLEDSLNNLDVDDTPSMRNPVNYKEQQTWDGFSKFDSIPSQSNEPIQSVNEMSERDILKEKFKYIRLLEDLEKKGVNLSKKYDMESSLLEMKGEYETILSEKERTNSVKFQNKMLMALITGVEFLNNKFDPFDVNLDGWGEQVNENMTEYDDIFGELYEKYKSKGKIAPEIKLMFQLAGSAVMIHMTNTMFKSSMPGMDDIMRQNPDLMNQFTKAAVDQMSRNNSGFGNFMNMSNGMASGNGMASANSRPDLNFAREDAELPLKSSRSEMKGPNDISDILSGLKTRQEDDSTISVEDMKDIRNATKPKKSKRRSQNTLSLNL
jgi:hypothetical protein